MTLPSVLVLDTNCLIYRLDDPDGPRGSWLDENVFRPAIKGDLDLRMSTVALAEVLTRPYSDGQPARAHAVRRALETLPGLTLVPLTADIADLSSRLRGETRVSLPDAIMLATAQFAGAGLLTNDRQLLQPAGPVTVLLLDDEMAQSQ